MNRKSKIGMVGILLLLIMIPAAISAGTGIRATGTGSGVAITTSLSQQIQQVGSADTSSELTAEWWQWVLSIPPAENPMLDTTGQNCSVGQRGNIWFLVGTFNGGTAIRTCTVPQDKQLFFPVINYVNISAPGIGGQGPGNYLVKDQRRDAATYINNAANLSVKLDGKKIKEITRIKSEVFDVAFTADNVFGVPAGVYSPAVDDGFYVMLDPLNVGTHTLNFHSENPPAAFSLDVTYNLKVVPVFLQ
jgi:hypothetical protein